METIQFARSQVRSVRRVAALGGLTLGRLALADLHRVLRRPEHRDAIFDHHMRAWVRSLLNIFGVELHIRGNISPCPAGRLVVSNHRSPIDIAILLSAFGGHVLSRKDLADWPVIGLAARRAGTIFVDRAESSSGLHAMRQIRRLLDAGKTVIVFPEGGTFPGDVVQPFRAGAFLGLVQANTMIQPVGLAYQPGCEFVDESFLEHLTRISKRPRTVVAVEIGDLVEPSQRAQTSSDRAHAVVQSLVHRARTMSLQPGINC